MESSRPLAFNPLRHPQCLSNPLRFAATAWSEHVPFAMYLVAALRPRLIVELGTFTGVSYCAFCQAVRELSLKARCCAIDTWRGDEHNGFYGAEVLEDLRAHHDPLYGGFSSLVQSTFDEALPRFRDGEIDLLHIDGYHTYEAVRHDFEAWLPKMSGRGIILMHDTNVRERDFGVWRLWEELKPRFPHFEFTHEHGLGLISTGAHAPEGLRPLLEASEEDTATIRRLFQELGQRLKVRLEKDEAVGALSEHVKRQEQTIRQQEQAVSTLSAQLTQTSARLDERESRLAGILSSRAWRWVNRYGRAKNLLLSVISRQRSPRQSPQLPAAENDQLRADLDSHVPEALVVGKGSALYLSGWCYHVRNKISGLEISVGGVPHPVKAFRMGKRDVWETHYPDLDPDGRSFCSGFWAILPLPEIKQEVEAELTLRATLADGAVRTKKLASIVLKPKMDECERARFDGFGRGGSAPLVAVCMTAYNPPAELFARQVESIRNQTHTNWVCMISDDGSRPEIFGRMLEIIGDDQRFQVTSNSSRLGFYRNFESCLARAPEEAEFIALCDHDDEWHADKLESLLSEFDENTPLVYSDMNIVDESGRRLARTYWTTRPNNFKNFASLILTNTITGAACMFPRRLLEYLLPFPERIGDAFHDHWIACVALATGDVKYIDRPLYDYVQHANNVLGHFAPAPQSGRARLKESLGDLMSGRKSIHTNFSRWQGVYFYDLPRLQLIARTISLRCSDRLTGAKRRTLGRIISADESALSAAWLALRNLKNVGRVSETLGAEGSILGAILWKKCWALRSRLMPAPASRMSPAGVPGPEELTERPAAVALAQTKVIEQKITPLRLAVSSAAPKRINLLIPTIDFRFFFAGYITKFNLARHLAEAGFKVRLVIVDHCDFSPPLWKEQAAGFQGLEDVFDRVEVTYAFERSKPVEVSPDDLFIATTWWTAHIAHRASRELRRERFLYLIQEYEPFTFPMGTLASLAEQSYSFPHYAIFSTEFLRDYFRGRGLGVFANGGGAVDRHSISFQNTITSVGRVEEEEIARRAVKKFLLYARPETHAARNMFELALMALARAIESGYFVGRWEFYGIGTVGASANIRLSEHTYLKMLPRQSQGLYRETLRSHDLGLSLMYTPHPSLIPIEMAAAGMLVVTNTYANKTREKLCEISSNIIAVEPTVEAVCLGLKEAVEGIEDYGRRTRGSRVRWSTDWNDSFGDGFMAKVGEFMEATLRSAD